jgi:hypothetical protein
MFVIADIVEDTNKELFNRRWWTNRSTLKFDDVRRP